MAQDAHTHYNTTSPPLFNGEQNREKLLCEKLFLHKRKKLAKCRKYVEEYEFAV